GPRAAVDGIVQQGPFLQSLGLEARAGVLLANAAVDQKREIRFAVRRLIDSSEMGTLFKVLGLRSPSMARLPGF
ncbi:methyltransferase, partial [Rhodospirillum rubrum]|nr:methyltransferase [Rhodospirillum rubrum]